MKNWSISITFTFISIFGTFRMNIRMLGLRPNIRIFEYSNHPYTAHLIMQMSRQLMISFHFTGFWRDVTWTEWRPMRHLPALPFLFYLYLRYAIFSVQACREPLPKHPVIGASGEAAEVRHQASRAQGRLAAEVRRWGCNVWVQSYKDWNLQLHWCVILNRSLFLILYPLPSCPVQTIPQKEEAAWGPTHSPSSTSWTSMSRTYGSSCAPSSCAPSCSGCQSSGP